MKKPLALGLATLASLALLAVVAMMSEPTPQAGAGDGPQVINVRANIDGRSRLILKGVTARWQHLDFAAPGRHLCTPGAPISPTLVDSRTWFPDWPDVPDCENRDCNCLSDVFRPVAPPIPRKDIPIFLQPVTCRFSCTIVQLPAAANDFTLIVEFNDNPPPGSDDYEVNIIVGPAVGARLACEGPAPFPAPFQVNVSVDSQNSALTCDEADRADAAVLGPGTDWTVTFLLNGVPFFAQSGSGFPVFLRPTLGPNAYNLIMVAFGIS